MCLSHALCSANDITEDRTKIRTRGLFLICAHANPPSNNNNTLVGWHLGIWECTLEKAGEKSIDIST